MLLVDPFDTLYEGQVYVGALMQAWPFAYPTEDTPFGHAYRDAYGREILEYADGTCWIFVDAVADYLPLLT